MGEKEARGSQQRYLDFLVTCRHAKELHFCGWLQDHYQSRNEKTKMKKKKNLTPSDKN